MGKYETRNDHAIDVTYRRRRTMPWTTARGRVKTQVIRQETYRTSQSFISDRSTYINTKLSKYIPSADITKLTKHAMSDKTR